MERQLNDQAASLRKIAWTKDRSAVYISISSGKGGVGKTTFTINLACMLARAGKNVLVFDADLGLANIDIMLKIPPRMNIRMYLEGKAGIEEILIKNVFGFDLFPASSGVVELAELSEDHFDKIQHIMVALDRYYDYVLFDTGAGIAGNVHKFASIADNVVVVSQPEPAAIADAYAFLKTARQLYALEKAYLVFNRVDDKPSAEKIYDNLRGVVQKFLNVELISLGNLSEDGRTRRAVWGQKPLCLAEPDSPFVEDIQGIVEMADKIWAK